MLVRVNKIEEGKCPICGGFLQYTETTGHEGEWIEKGWECPKCKLKGSQWYKLHFEGHNVCTRDGREIVLEKVGQEIEIDDKEDLIEELRKNIANMEWEIERDQKILEDLKKELGVKENEQAGADRSHQKSTTDKKRSK